MTSLDYSLDRRSGFPIDDQTNIQAAKGYAYAHHGEILQGVFHDNSGSLTRGLVTLPCRALTAEAEFVLLPDDALTVSPVGKAKAAAAAHKTLEYLGLSKVGGKLVLNSPVPVGYGLGSSTCDVVATIRAVAAAVGVSLSEPTIGSLAVAAEGASDAIMFDECVLFAQRDGRVLERLGHQLPPFLTLSINTAPGLPVDTLATRPAEYDAFEIKSFETLRAMLRRAVQDHNLALLGRVATASARISQRHQPKPHFQDLQEISQRCGAVGIQVAHSGTLAGLMFDPQMPGVDHHIRLAADDLAQLALPASFVFHATHHELQHVSL